MSDSTPDSTTIVEGKRIKTAPLNVISWRLLESASPTEIQKLLESAETLGFFYLDFHDALGERFFEDLQSLYSLGKFYFAQPEKAKMKGFQKEKETG